MGTVWDRTAEFLTDNLTAIVPIALLAFFVPFSIQGNFAQVNDSANTQLSTVLALVSLAFSVLAMWGSLALAAMALDLADGKTAGRLAGKRLIPALVVAIVTGLGAAALVAPAALILWLNGIDILTLFRGEPIDLPAAVGWPLGLYMILLVPALLWLCARLALSSAVVVAEKRMLGAIRRSFELTRGIALRIVGVLLLYVLVSSVAALATRTVFGSIFQLIAGPADGGISLSQVLTSVMVAAVQTGFTMIAPVFTAKLYRALTAERGAAAKA
jgi:hypothetical protein